MNLERSSWILLLLVASVLNRIGVRDSFTSIAFDVGPTALRTPLPATSSCHHIAPNVLFESAVVR